MFAVGDKVKYTYEYILEAEDNLMERLYAAAWRGIIAEDYGTGIYLVCDADFPADSEDMSENILEIAED